jgi:LmbE family N-acetylglucosaminyl deacetylase
MTMPEPREGGPRQTAHRSAAELLAALVDPTRKPVAAHHVAVVAAHPDDETIGCGAQLARLMGATIVIVSDGAPRDLSDATAHGFDSAAGYAAAREKELSAALALAGVPQRMVVTLRLPDQGVAFALVDIARRLRDLCCRRGITLLLTHPYEGGHPDHDATAFAVHAAKVLLRRWGRAVSIIEMPFYFLSGEGLVVQRFAPGHSEREVVLHLEGEAQTLKRAMIARHATQRRTLSLFATDAERFRSAPAYDFAALPNGGRLFYAQQPWGMDGERWLQLSREALDEFGTGVRPWS